MLRLLKDQGVYHNMHDKDAIQANKTTWYAIDQYSINDHGCDDLQVLVCLESHNQNRDTHRSYKQAINALRKVRDAAKSITGTLPEKLVITNGGDVCLAIERDYEDRLHIPDYVGWLGTYLATATWALTDSIVSHFDDQGKLESLWEATGRSPAAYQNILDNHTMHGGVFGIGAALTDDIAIAAQRINTTWMTERRAATELVQACVDMRAAPMQLPLHQVGNIPNILFIVRE
jgi:hypothetical protein